MTDQESTKARAEIAAMNMAIRLLMEREAARDSTFPEVARRRMHAALAKVPVTAEDEPVVEGFVQTRAEFLKLLAQADKMVAEKVAEVVPASRSRFWSKWLDRKRG